MIELVPATHPFSALTRAVRVSTSWPIRGSQAELAGPIVLDIFQESGDQFLGELIESALSAAVALNGWNEEQLLELRAAAWRSAHRYLVKNVDVVDRGREANELARLLGVDRK